MQNGQISERSILISLGNRRILPHHNVWGVTVVGDVVMVISKMESQDIYVVNT
jgi:hypothetical protein